jgi:hypothetical protein
MKALTQQLFMIFTLALILISCSGKDSYKATAVGNASDLLIVMDDTIKTSPGGEFLREMINQPMLALPQDEPIFTLSVTPHRYFSDYMKSMRNIIIVEINPAAKKDTILYFREYWAKEQALVKIVARNNKQLLQLAENSEIKMISFFSLAERNRNITFFRKFPNLEFTKIVKDTWGIELLAPTGFNKNKSGKDFSWFSIETNLSSTGVLIYSFPYTGKNSLDKDILIQKRDSVLRLNLRGERPDSYMTTELEYPIIYKGMLVNGVSTAEIRGLWRMVGDMMGGPFVSHAHIDQVNNRVIVTEGYVYAPEKPNKRNSIRQLEAILYTYKPMPGDITTQQ